MKMKQILAGVLTAAMVLTCTPVSSLAAEDSTASDAETRLNPGATVTENEVIFVPNEDGTFADFNSTDNADVMNFLNTVTDFEVTVVYKFTDASSLSATSYALFTLADDDGADYFTVRHAPKRTTSEGDIAWAYNGSAAGLKFGKAEFLINDTKWHKLSFSMSSSKKMNVVYDGKAPFNDNWNASSACPSTFPGTASSPTTYDHVYIGKVAPGKTYTEAVGSNVDFPGTIKYVKVSKTPVANNTELMQENTSINEISSKAWDDAKKEYTNLTAENDYTAATWISFAEKLNAEPSTEREMLDAIDELKTAYAALVASTADTKAATLTALQERISTATLYKNKGADTYVSGYTELVTKIEEVSAIVLNSDNCKERELQDALAGLNAVIDGLVFVDKVYTNVAVGNDIYDAEDALFYSNMDSLTYTVVFKYNAAPNTQYAPLVTLRDDNGKYVTIYFGVVTNSNNGRDGKVAFSYQGSGANAFTANPVKIDDTQYHKLTFSFKDGNINMRLDGGSARTISDTAQTAPGLKWCQGFVDTLNANAWTHVEIGKQCTNEIWASTGNYASDFPDSTIKYVQISRNANDANGVTTVNNSTNDGIVQERDALVAEKADTISNGVSTYYTSDSWTAYETACTNASEATTDWDIMNKIDALKTAKDGLTKTSPQFSGYSITLGGKIGVKFYTEVAEDDDTKAPAFTSGSSELTSVQTVENGKKVYTVELPAKKMADDIIVDMKNVSTNECLDRVVCSVADYADTLLADDAQSDELKALVKAMLNYGAAAQVQFSYNTENPANASLNDTDKAVAEIGTELDADCGSMGVTADGYKGLSLVLNSETALKLYATTDASIVLKKDGAEVAVSGSEKNNGFSYVTLANIAANHLQDTYTVEIGGTAVGTVSPLLYCYNVTKGSFDASLKNLVNALYQYNKAAVAYNPSSSSNQ